jgi:hypothetical protein
MLAHRTRVTGSVRRERIAPGSKSDHIGFVLDALDGQRYHLRRRGHSSFGDESLAEYLGLDVEIEGVAAGPSLVVESVRRAS